jgi:two-component system sensor histidine kinase/response regulator
LPFAKQQQYLQIIQDSGKHLLELINDILEFSQLEAGKAVLNLQAIELQPFSQRVLRGFEEEAQKKNIRLVLDFQGNDPGHYQSNDSALLFWADPDRLQQILLHLIHNGIKFTPEEGRVTLRVWREQSMAVFQLEDTGIGILDHQLPLLFEQFEQLEKSLQRTYGGTGLGLALTKQLVDLHGGIIEVESVAGQGSIFTVRIPNQFHKKAPKLATPAQDAFGDRVNRSVVLLMQEEEGATLICELLTAANYQVIWLAEESPSLRRIELLKPILVIIDRDLPNAFEISQFLKKSPVLRSLKVLLLSPSIASSDLSAGEQDSIDDYLPKPLEPNVLLERINSLSAFEAAGEKLDPRQEEA